MSTASSILLQRIQTVGENVNLWGGYINTNLENLERASKGYEALAVTGDATISWTNYAATNSGSVAFLKLTGTVTGVLTFPAYQNHIAVWNANSASVTIKCSGGTGVTLATGQRALIYCDGTDFYNAGPTLGPTQTQSTSTYAYAQWGAVETAIATAALPATAGTLLNSATDTTAGYHAAKHTVAFSSATTTQLAGLLSVQFSTQNSGASEKHLMTVAPGYVGGFLNGGVKSAQFTPSQGTAYDVDCTAAGVTVALSSMTSVMIGQEIKLNNFGNFPMFLLGTVNGQTNLSISAPQNGAYRYSSASWGWN